MFIVSLQYAEPLFCSIGDRKSRKVSKFLLLISYEHDRKLPVRLLRAGQQFMVIHRPILIYSKRNSLRHNNKRHGRVRLIRYVYLRLVRKFCKFLRLSLKASTLKLRQYPVSVLHETVEIQIALQQQESHKSI